MVALFAIAAAVATPVIYVHNWQSSVWCPFASGIAQVAATALLFENVGAKKKTNSVETSSVSAPSVKTAIAEDSKSEEGDVEGKAR